MDLSSARSLNPLITEDGLRALDRIRQHPCAPRWTCAIGDHLLAEDLAAVVAFRAELSGAQAAAQLPPPWLTRWVADRREQVPLWRERIPAGFDFERDWAWLPTMCRADLAAAPERVVPLDADLERLIVYETSGTTGHALRVPHHPGAVAKLHVVGERALGWHGVKVQQGPDAVACMNLHAQAHLWVYPSVFTVWREAGFARLNLNPHAWAGGMSHARRFIEELAPGFLAGDPASFAELLRQDIRARPLALLSTAVALPGALAKKLQERLGCPVMDWYSTTETGPIACSKPGGTGLAVLPTDLHVELLDEHGFPVPEGQRGEVTVSGGRNPYLPLLRYRTGDHARFETQAGERRLVDLEGRAAVLFRALDGSPINPVDVGRVLRHEFAVLQHEFLQRADGSCRATLRPVPGIPVSSDAVHAQLQALFGAGARIDVELDEDLGKDQKPVPYRSELEHGTVSAT